MQDIYRIKIVAGVDLIVAVLLFIAGIIITLLGTDYLSMISMYTNLSGYNPFTSFGLFPWLIVIFGIATIIYGLKRLIDDILKMITTVS